MFSQKRERLRQAHVWLGGNGFGITLREEKQKEKTRLRPSQRGSTKATGKAKTRQSFGAPSAAKQHTMAAGYLREVRPLWQFSQPHPCCARQRSRVHTARLSLWIPAKQGLWPAYPIAGRAKYNAHVRNTDRPMPIDERTCSHQNRWMSMHCAVPKRSPSNAWPRETWLTGKTTLCNHKQSRNGPSHPRKSFLQKPKIPAFTKPAAAAHPHPPAAPQDQPETKPPGRCRRPGFPPRDR